MREFVVFDDGEESDWIDPVVSVNETATAWFVDNGHHVYEVPQLPGRRVEVRQRDEPAGPGRDLTDGETIHVMPVNDDVMHENTSGCVCVPDVEHVPNEHGPDGWLYTHHSLDGREHDE